MKLRTGLIVFSLTANAALGVVWYQHRASRVIVSRPESPDVKATARGPAHIALDAEAWKKLNVADDASFVATLREQGFPPEAVRALVWLRVQARYADRQRALRNAPARPYWRSNPWMDNRDAATRAAQRELNSEIAAEVKRLMGDDGDSWVGQLRQKQLYGSLSPEKASQIEAIDNDYNELTTQARDAAGGVVLPEDREKLAYLEKERRADLAKLLTPEELAEYDLRASYAAVTTRYLLSNFMPSEDEFRTLVRLQLAFDEKYGSRYLSGAQEDRRQAAEPELQAQIQAALGPERFAEYQVTTDPVYGRVNSLVQRFQLPSTTTADVVKVQRDITQRADAVRNDASLTPENRAAQMAALGLEATSRLQTALGAEGYAAYRKMYAGWMNRFQPAAGNPNAKR